MPFSIAFMVSYKYYDFINRGIHLSVAIYLIISTTTNPTPEGSFALMSTIHPSRPTSYCMPVRVYPKGIAPDSVGGHRLGSPEF